MENLMNLMNFEFKVNPSICEFVGDEEQLYQAFKSEEGNDYAVCWKTDNGRFQVPYSKEEVAQAVADGDWIIKG